MKAIICSNIDEFNRIERHLYESLRDDPAVRAHGNRWAFPIIHPLDGRIALPIEERVEKYLTADELARIVELTPDWFPEPEELL